MENIKINKIRKKFYYEDIELRIAEVEETYLNSEMKCNMTRVLAPNGGVIPISFKHKQTLKSIITDTLSFINQVKLRGIDVKYNLVKNID